MVEKIFFWSKTVYTLGEGYPGVYGDVFAYKEWIEAKINNPPLSDFEEIVPLTGSVCTTRSRKRRSSAVTKIIGGAEATAQSHPWIVSIWTLDQGMTLDQSCSGTIIDNHFILTAGSCCSEKTNLFLKFGDHTLDLGGENNEFTILINDVNSETFIHDGFNDGSSNMCLIRSEVDIIELGEQENCGAGCVEVACLPTGSANHGAACWTAGWGGTSIGSDSSNVLNEVGVNIMDDSYCSNFSDPDFAFHVNEMCVGLPDTDEDGLTDTTQGPCNDLGAPLVCPVDGNIVLTGVANVNVCLDVATAGKPSKYGDVWTFMPWISSTMAAQVPTTTVPPTTTTVGFTAVSNSPPLSLTHCGSAPSSDGSRKRRDARIYGGTADADNSWPWLVKIVTTDSAGNTRSNGGTIIGESGFFVLTEAKTCNDAATVSIEFGDSAAPTHFTMTVENLSENLIIHESYSHGTSNANNLCLIRVNKFVTDTTIWQAAAAVNCGDGCVHAACIPSNAATHGDACWTAGWGRVDDTGADATSLMEDGVNIMSDAWCTSAMPTLSFETNDEFCAGLPSDAGNVSFGNSAGANTNDGGNPLICQNSSGQAELTGIATTHGLTGSPGIYIETSVFSDWIADALSTHEPKTAPFVFSSSKSPAASASASAASGGDASGSADAASGTADAGTADAGADSGDDDESGTRSALQRSLAASRNLAARPYLEIVPASALDTDAGAGSTRSSGSIGLPSSGITIEAEIRPSAWEVDGQFKYGGIVNFVQDSGLNEFGWYLSTRGENGKFKFGIKTADSNGFVTIETADNLDAGVWYHLVATYDGQTVQLFMNGELV